MTRRRSALFAFGAVLIIASGASALGGFSFELLPPHVAKKSAASVDPKLVAEIDAQAAKSAPKTVDDVLRRSLEISDAHLHFGLQHPTLLSFGAGEREANCIEYAHLYAFTFDRIASKAGVKARAFVVHSAKARVFGMKIPMKGWEDHDWVLVDAGSSRRFVDPTLHDAGLGWNIESNVKGTVTVPP